VFLEGLECCCRDDVLWQRVPDPGSGNRKSSAAVKVVYSC